MIGLPSSGAHTNGYSLIRAIFADVPLETEVDGVGQLGQALLEPHRCYLGPLARLHQAGIPLQGAAHITGGGLVENIPRALPPDLTARINPDAWPVPPLFRYIQQTGGVSNEEMRRVFNLGIGLVIIVKAALAKEALAALDEGWLVGEVVHGYELEWID